MRAKFGSRSAAFAKNGSASAVFPCLLKRHSKIEVSFAKTRAQFNFFAKIFSRRQIIGAVKGQAPQGIVKHGEIRIALFGLSVFCLSIRDIVTRSRRHCPGERVTRENQESARKKQ